MMMMIIMMMMIRSMMRSYSANILLKILRKLSSVAPIIKLKIFIFYLTLSDFKFLYNAIVGESQ